jgi:predicted amidohydrolase
MRLALWQTEGHFEGKAANLAALSRMAQASALAGADIVLCPECWLSGYNLSKEACEKEAEPQGGTSMQVIGRIAADNNIAIAYGYVERDGAVLYNSAAFVGCDGNLLGHYRKVHLFSDFEHARYIPSNSFAPSFLYRDWRIGLLICYDVEFPEAVRAVALEGANLILIPTALTPEYGAVPDRIVPARAVENQIFVAYCNHSGVENGLEFLGSSCLAGPYGEKLVAAGAGEALLIADISHDMLERAKPVFPYRRDRRPELY